MSDIPADQTVTGKSSADFFNLNCSAQNKMATWEYKIETVRGFFKSGTTKLKELQQVCNMLGQDGWELVNVSYTSMNDQYVAYFKRPEGKNSPE